MKKIISLAVIIILSCSFPLFSSAQTELNNTLKPPEQLHFKNQFDLDVHLLALEATYKRRLTKNLFIGLGGKFGTSLGYTYHDNRLRDFLDILHEKILLDYIFSKKFHMYIGVVYGLFSLGVDNNGVFKGLETGLFYKIGKWEIGLQSKLGYAYETDFLYVFPTVSIKIPIVRW